jgi:hypothetical protein
MRFLRQNQYVLLFLAVLVFSGIMVLREVQARDLAHVQRRENFLLAHDRADTTAEQRLYQLLIGDLPTLSDRALADDLQRTGLLFAGKKPEPENLVWKLNVSVGNELRQRAEQRLARQRQAGEFK